MRSFTRKGVLMPVLAGVALTAAACGGAGSTNGASGTASKSASPGASAVSVSASSFTRDFSAMTELKPLVAKGKGKIAAIMPDTVTSTRYTEFDQPYLKEAFQKAGLPSSEFTVQNAQGSDSTELTDAQSAIASGASVLIMDPIDSGVGAQIEKYAASHGAAVVDYDRLTVGGSRKYYVSFNNVEVGKLIGQGLVSCVSAWHVSKPQVLVMRGDPTDNNATLFAQGYDAVMAPYFSSGKWVKVGQPAGTWTPSVAQTEFEQQYTAHPTMNAALTPNDENTAPIITYLQTRNIKPKTFPLTGQDATLTGLQNILSGYQCGTAYKPIYLEAQAAVALALYLRAGEIPPQALVNGPTTDPKTGVKVDSVLLTPEWVTPSNMAATVIKDNFVPASQLCAGKYAAACKADGITS